MSRHRTSTNPRRTSMSEEQREKERIRARAKYETDRFKILAARKEYYHRTLETRRWEKLRAHWKSRGVDVSTIRWPRPAVCDTPGCGGTKKISLDHDHATGKFRGWLCDVCNRSIGLLKERPDVLRALANYLEEKRDTNHGRDSSG